jgi:tetratricopeptide (TPR) repeat protein
LKSRRLKESDQPNPHVVLAEFLGTPPWTSRTFDELPWHYIHLDRPKELAELLARTEYLRHAWPRRPQEILFLWSWVRNRGGTLPFVSLKEEQDSIVRSAWSRILEDAGYLVQALELCGDAAAENSDPGDAVRRATLLHRLGRADEALGLLTGVEKTVRGRQAWEWVSLCLGNRAVLLRERGEFEAALRLHDEERDLCRRRNDEPAEAICLGNRAIVMKCLQRPEEAETDALAQERLARRSGDLRSIADSLGIRGCLRHDKRKYSDACRLFQQQLELLRHLGDRNPLQESLANHARAAELNGDYDEAGASIRERLDVCRRPPELFPDMAECLIQLALLHRKLKFWESVRESARQARQIAVQHAPFLLPRIDELLSDADNQISHRAAEAAEDAPAD